jgi:hypothetical protein
MPARQQQGSKEEEENEQEASRLQAKTRRPSTVLKPSRR